MKFPLRSTVQIGRYVAAQKRTSDKCGNGRRFKASVGWAKARKRRAHVIHLRFL